MSTELSQYKSYQEGKEYFGHFASVPRILDVVCTSPLVTPQWANIKFTVKKADGTVVSNATSSINIETGFKVDVELNWKWVHNDVYADPDSCVFSPNFSQGSILPSTNVNSATYTAQNVTASTTYIAHLYRTITAPSVDTTNKILLKPTGNEKLHTQVGTSISFRHRIFVGKTTKSVPTSKSDLVKLSNYNIDLGLVTSRAYVFNDITTAPGEYFCYMYPKALGKMTQIIQDGATPITDSFNCTEISILNDAGVTIDYYVYTSVNDGAFSAAKIDFK